MSAKLSAHIVAEASPAEMDEQWQRIEGRLSRESRRHRWLPLSLALAGSAAALIAIVTARRPSAEQAFTSDGDSVPVELADGSRFVLAARSQIQLLRQESDGVTLRLVRGGARFDVRNAPGRRFQVTAADLDVAVTGTAFSVTVEGQPPIARVAVERGEVEVHPRGQARLLARLHANESWPSAPPPPLAPAPPAGSPAPAAQAETSRAAPVRTPAPAVARRSPSSDPRSLLEQSNVARRAGDVEQAVALLETLRVRHPRDPRTALATFELGRLRMDALGDLAGAVQALRHSIALAPTGVFREDAEACLATAYSRMRDGPRCARARQTYLSHYPTGTHAAEVSALACPAR